MKIRPYFDSPEEEEVLFYAVPESNPSCYPTVFTDRFWDDRERWTNLGVGTVYRSHRPVLTHPEVPGLGPIFGTPAEFINGISLADVLAGRRVSVPCIQHAAESVGCGCGSASAVESFTGSFDWTASTGGTTTATAHASATFHGSASEGGTATAIDTDRPSYTASGVEGGTSSATEAATTDFLATGIEGGASSGVFTAAVRFTGNDGGGGSSSGTETAGASYTGSGGEGGTSTATEHTFVPLTSFNCNTIAAAGNSQGTATSIGDDQVDVTGADGTKGVILPSGCYRIAIRNTSVSFTLKVYPPSGENINGLPTNTAGSINSGQAAMYLRMPGGVWRVVTLS